MMSELSLSRPKLIRMSTVAKRCNNERGPTRPIFASLITALRVTSEVNASEMEQAKRWIHH
jgi:hypothetical protein